MNPRKPYVKSQHPPHSEQAKMLFTLIEASGAVKVLNRMNKILGPGNEIKMSTMMRNSRGGKSYVKERDSIAKGVAGCMAYYHAGVCLTVDDFDVDAIP